METKNDENPERTAPTPGDAFKDATGDAVKTTSTDGTATGDTTAEETGTDPDGSTSPTDPAPPVDPGTSTDSGTDGSSDGDGETDRPDNGSDGGEGGDGGESEENGEGEDDGNPARPFEDRFLNNGAEKGDDTPRRESLAVSLLRMALALLTGEVPEEKFIPLMDAVIAREAIIAARSEGEIAGRNAIIEEQLATPAIAPPDLNGTPIARSRRPATSIFDLAGMAR